MPHVRLASKMCKTCVFRPGDPVDLNAFRKRWGEYGHQTCHQFMIKGQNPQDAAGESRDVWCRGFWENEVSAKEKEILQECGLVETVPQKEG